MLISFGVLIVFLAFLSSCAHYPVNDQLEHFDTELQGRTISFHSPERSDELFLVLAFSGGGARAAALAYGVLEALENVRLPVTPNGVGMSVADKPRTLLDEVDTISSVSGGSFTAAYYGLHQKRIFKDFKERFLTRNIERALYFRLLSPVNWVRLASSKFGRSDLASEYYDKILFEGATLKDLVDSNGPFVQIQATDMIDGLHFEFTSPLFNMICSDFETFPVSRAVAASAAFPGAFTPIVLKNYAQECGYNEAPWISGVMDKRDTSSREFHAATRMRTYQDSETKPFLYLLDGGIADNLGVRGPLEVLAARVSTKRPLEEFGLHQTRRVLYIVVNAERPTSTKSSMLGKIPGLGDVLGATSSIMVKSINYDTMDLLRRMTSEWSKEVESMRGKDLPLDFYIAEVDFDALASDEERSYFSAVPTKLSLPEETVDRLRDIGGRILYASKDFQEFVQHIGGEIPDNR